MINKTLLDALKRSLETVINLGHNLHAEGGINGWHAFETALQAAEKALASAQQEHTAPVESVDAQKVRKQAKIQEVWGSSPRPDLAKLPEVAKCKPIAKGEKSFQQFNDTNVAQWHVCPHGGRWFGVGPLFMIGEQSLPSTEKDAEIDRDAALNANRKDGGL